MVRSGTFLQDPGCDLASERLCYASQVVFGCSCNQKPGEVS
jgi:hypothetical protein